MREIRTRIKTVKNISLVNNGSDRSWHFTKVATAGPVLYKSAMNKLALAQSAGITNLAVLTPDDGSGKNLSVYQIDLSQ